MTPSEAIRLINSDENSRAVAPEIARVMARGAECRPETQDAILWLLEEVWRVAGELKGEHYLEEWEGDE